jgi:deoxycytidylate deaminase
MTRVDDVIEKLIIKAQTSNLNNKHSACLIKNKYVYSFGVNKCVKEVKIGSHTGFLTIHAEVDAICNLNKKSPLEGLDIIIIRINKSNVLRNSRPCNACIEKLRKKGIRRAYYSDENGAIICEEINEMPMLHESSGSLFRKKLAGNN